MTGSLLRRRFAVALLAGLALAALPGWAADRFTPIIEGAGESTVNAGGFVVNAKRVAVQRELARRPPTAAELGLQLPPRSVLDLENTARQIAQYHPRWRIYQYRVDLPREDFVRHFEAQGLRLHGSRLLVTDWEGDFIDGFGLDPVTGRVAGFRVWRKPAP